MSENTENEINEICEKHKIPQRHTDFQIENFIIGKETSNHGKIWQCLRELNQRKETLYKIDIEKEELEDNLSIAKINLKKTEIELHRAGKESNKYGIGSDPALREIYLEKKTIKARKQKRKILNIEDSLLKMQERRADVLHEANVFLNIFKSLTKETPFIDINDNEAQLEFWTAKFHSELNLNALLNQPTSSELVKSALALPNGSVVKVQMQAALENISKKIKDKNN